MITYDIRPSVDPQGAPTWTLYKTDFSMLGAYTKKLAENKDRLALEGAVRHLKDSEHFAARPTLKSGSP